MTGMHIQAVSKVPRELMHIKLGLLFVLMAILGHAEVTASLNGEWKFALATGLSQADALTDFYKDGFDTSGFRPITVPSNWALLGFEEPMYGRLQKQSEGFYLHTFLAPRETSGERVLLHFDGVWASAEVWLNGQALGRHDSGFTSFAFDVTGKLRAGEENRLAVRVRQVTRDYLYDANDDWSLGGIYRDVWLEWMPADCYLDRIETSTTFDGQYRDATLHVRAFVTQSKSASQSYRLRMILSDPNGAEVQHRVFDIPAHPSTARDTLAALSVAEPLPWTAETPALYQLRVDLVAAGATIHSRSTSVGFREVSTANGILRINGQQVKLRGVDRHDESPDVGRATRREHWLQDIRLMKAANINFIRTSHYPPAEGFIRLCDELGMYVLEEVPMGYGGDLGSDPSFTPGALLRAQETIARDRNHPSVIIWSIGNEDPLTVTHLAAIRLVKGSDPTRPVLMPWRAEEWLPPEIDILAPHYWTESDYDRLAAHSHRPVLTTEYTHALGEEGFGGLEARWQAITRHPAGAGGAIWMWQDQGLNVNGKLLLNPRGIDGIVNSDRTPQRDYWETRAVYAPVGVVRRITFLPGQTTISIPVTNKFDFLNLDTVKIRWKLLADGHLLDSGESRLHAEPHTTASFILPTKALANAAPDAAGYAHLVFLHPDGTEIITRSVELVSAAVPVPARPESTVRVRRGKDLTFSAAGVNYVFSSATAQLISATVGTQTVLTGARFIIWRPLTEIEKLWFLRNNGTLPRLPDLNEYSTVVRSWKEAASGGGVQIEAVTEHRVDDRNSFVVTCLYRIRGDGSLHIGYSVEPHIEAPWIPEAGLELSTVPELRTLRWVGLGPIDSYPNESAAALFGLWQMEENTPDAHNQKSGVHWAELLSGSGAAVRVTGTPYIRFERSGRLRVLSAIVGRPAKNRRPDRLEDRLETSAGTVFTGSLTVTLAPPKRHP